MLQSHFEAVSKQLNASSAHIGELYRSHKPTLGREREELIEEFFSAHLPAKFGVGSGLIYSPSGDFSNQADTVIFDKHNNKPLHAGTSGKLFLVESVYCLIEAKTNLSPTQLDDAIEKCVRFKNLKREFGEFVIPKSRESLFVIFAFSASAPEKFYTTLKSSLDNLPLDLRPDFIVVPGSFMAFSGKYFELSQAGEKNSLFRRELESKGLVDERLSSGLKFAKSPDSLLLFFLYLTSWLQRAGSRASDAMRYVRGGETVGAYPND